VTPAPAARALPSRTQRTRPGLVIRNRSLVLGAYDTAPADARATLRECLSQWQLGHLEDDAEQILSELVANAVNVSRQAAPAGQARAAITITIAVERDELRLQAWDPDPLPPPRDYLPGTWDESGRGLIIVKALAHQWGTSPGTNGGKHVFATLLTATQPQARQQHQDTP
jgi:anti-sigma regulatory factor (Ser/Thr protein kinase)